VRLYRFILLLVVIASAIMLISQYDAGYIYLRYLNWQFESSLTFTLLLLTTVFFIVMFIYGLIGGTVNIPRNIGRWQKHRNHLKAQKSTNEGLIALAEGNWDQAEKKLSRHARITRTPLINYLGAARAAQYLGAEKRRDNYLAQAHRNMPEAELAIGITQAELQYSHGQIEKALATLKHLQSITPRHKYVLHLLKKCCEQLKSWDDLLPLLPLLRQQKLYEKSEMDALEETIHMELLSSANDRISHLHKVWNTIPSHLRQKSRFISQYANELIDLGAVSECENILRNHLKNHWDPQLIRIYGLVQGDDLMLQLNSAEQWLKEYHRHPELNLSLGRISLKNQLWGKAKSYFEMSIHTEPRAETYYELGTLLQFMHEESAAAECFSNGLKLATKESTLNYPYPEPKVIKTHS
jgi:HemY protein